jgi:hypothetical protein
MRTRYAALAIGCALGLAAPSYAARASLPTLTSEVYQATGDHAAIARRANTCAAQLLHSGLMTIPVIISSDPEAGTVVAHNTFQIPIGKGHGVFAVAFDARSTVSIEAKDGRFRIEYTDLELLMVHDWQPIDGTQSLVDSATATLNGISASLSQCIIAGSKSDW